MKKGNDLEKLVSELIRRLAGQKGGKKAGGHGPETLGPTETMLDLARKILEELRKKKCK